MENNELSINNDNNLALLEQVVVNGDLAKLSAPQRLDYYRQVCQSMGLNPLSKPFDYINLNGKLTLYAKKDATDQLRKIHGVSIDDIKTNDDGDWFVVTVKGSDSTGRKDVEIGAVAKNDMRGNIGNALMKAVTKAKRRLTLSLCGLGWLDETEIETIPDAKPVVVDSETGEILDQPKLKKPDFDEEKFLLNYHHIAGLPRMSLDKAKAMETSEGKKYGDLDTKTLYGMTFGIKKAMAALQTDYEKEPYLNKLGAINEILSAKANEKQLENAPKDPFVE